MSQVYQCLSMPELVLTPLRLPNDWLAAINHVLVDGETTADFLRDQAIRRELKRRGVDVAKLSAVRGKGRPKSKVQSSSTR